MSLSRTGPDFGSPGRTDDGAPLADPYLSAHHPVCLVDAWPHGFAISASAGARLTLGGERITARRTVSLAELRRGLVLVLARRVALLLHLASPAPELLPEYGLIGHSDAIERVRRAIRRVADLDLPVLIRGESGVGKELVARAIHDASPRAGAPYTPVNMAALSASTAQAELFGHTKGAFTGASSRSPGLFEATDGGTVFLDEIGETPETIQPMLLRVLESGELQPLGSAQERRRVDVRVLAATDAELEAAVRAGRFRGPLLHRLAGYELRVPPLRERRDDIARLVVHLLGRELDKLGELHRLRPAPPDAQLWFPCALMVALVEHSWTGGNVRALANVVRQLVVANRGRDRLVPDERVRALLRGEEAAPAPDAQRLEASREAPPSAPSPRARRRAPAEIDEEELIAAMRAHAFKPKATAKALRIPESTIYDLIARSARLRLAKDIPREELERTRARHAGDLDAMVEQLMVSHRSLKQRLKELGLL